MIDVAKKLIALRRASRARVRKVDNEAMRQALGFIDVEWRGAIAAVRRDDFTAARHSLCDAQRYARGWGESPDEDAALAMLGS